MTPKQLIEQGFKHHVITFFDNSQDNCSFSKVITGHNSYECTFRVNGFPKSQVYLEQVFNLRTRTFYDNPANPLELKYKWECGDRDALIIGNVWNKLSKEFGQRESHESYSFVNGVKTYCNPRPRGTLKRVKPKMTNYRLRYYRQLAVNYLTINSFHSQKALKINQAFFKSFGKCSSSATHTD